MSLSTSTVPSNPAEDRLSSMLSSPNFSVASYLNLALTSDNSSPEQLQRRMAELALQLQLQTQACHEDIGRIGAELQAIMPRCAADVGRLGVGLEGMKVDAQTLLETTTVHNEEGEALSGSLETLSTLHALQSNLSKTKDILTAAATWDSTIASISPLLAEQNLNDAVDALSQLEHGERALQGMPQKDDRQAEIAKIRTQVQVMLQPQLNHALQNMSSRLGPLQQCVALYSKLDKMDSLQEEYVKNRPGEIHKAWFGFAPAIDTAAIEASSSNNNDSGFIAWLPTWYEKVLSLLTEERRQSSTVFGAEMAPEVLVLVLKECFRPILPSFESRLKSTCSADPSTMKEGAFESICTAYESTLRFLSLAYELIAASFLDVAESGNQTTNGAGLFDDIKEVSLQVASPFAKYMQSFDQLEGKHSEMATQLVSKDIQQCVGNVSVGNGLEALQDATERLKGLAPFVFPLVNGALDRFELMSGGFLVGEALAAVDQILTDHVGEMVISIRTLSAAMTTDNDKLADLFDEQYVLCAMDLLKMAGKFKRDLGGFEDGTRKRLTMIAGRLEDHSKLKLEVEEAKLSRSKKSSAFTLPDSLSVVEIDAVLAEEFCGDQENPEDGTIAAVSMLKRLSTVPEDDQSVLYPKTEDSIQRLANSCHSFIFDVCSAVPKKQLRDMSDMPAWSEMSEANPMDSYGTLPQQYVTLIGEHMLALVQAFEPFADDPETLSLANEVMDKVRDVAVQPWNEFVATAGVIGSSESIINTLMVGNDITGLVLQNSALTEEDAAFEEGISDAEKASAIFCNVWLDAIGLAVTGKMLEKIMRFSQLTPKGCEHLSADFNYLINVFSALGVAGHPHPFISHIAALAMFSDGELKAHIDTRNRGDPIEGALRAVEVRIALLRGISVD
eukprot:CAMPEP_0113633526 /NCGR_PEP_ID=MMETSP0017_2-20120614/17449_1 /TAXON_ID=2856 /ORGANISM="Cylindrotheca closterium" /LENGTH=899 /DNA_ID=CAMNT_0000544171 /DNA_START=92 /DNA_END=2791 /DNA_ORIENTATION=+ /assembly_acc=CAM_ASM_000147